MEKDPTLFYFPNTLAHHLEGKPFEEVSFFRDELANLVWAIEKKYKSPLGNVVARHDEENLNEPLRPEPQHYWDGSNLVEKPERFADGEPGNQLKRPVPLYLEKQVPPRNWIPYIHQALNFRRGLMQVTLNIKEGSSKNRCLSPKKRSLVQELES